MPVDLDYFMYSHLAYQNVGSARKELLYLPIWGDDCGG
jgi:hypothetical protein